MAVWSASPLDRVFVQAQASNTPRTITNSAGTWTNTGSILTRHQSLTLTQNRPTTTAPYKTGTRSNLNGIAGRTSGGFTWTGPLIPNGVTSTNPDLDPMFSAMFGQVGSAGAYTMLDTGILPFALFRFNRSGGSSPEHQIAGGCIPQRVTFTFGGEHMMMSVEGKCVAICSSAQFSQYPFTGFDTVSQFGLTTFPTEPSSGAPITVHGSLINGFGGTATMFTVSPLGLRGTYSIVLNTGLDFAEDGYLDGYPFAITSGRRTASISNMHFIDSDDTNLKTLKVNSFTKTSGDIVIVVNNISGATATFTLKSVQLNPYQIVENGGAFDINFSEATAHASAIGNIDDFSLAFT
jgi:hypothetical protein